MLNSPLLNKFHDLGSEEQGFFAGCLILDVYQSIKISIDQAIGAFELADWSVKTTNLFLPLVILALHCPSCI